VIDKVFGPKVFAPAAAAAPTRRAICRLHISVGHSSMSAVSVSGRFPPPA